MISITDYIQEISKQGIASPNRYWVTLTLPRGIDLSIWGNESINQDSAQGNIGKINTQLNGNTQLSVKCIQVQFPGRTLMTTENRHWGTPYKLPYSALYDEVSFTFVAADNLRERYFFEVWQEAVINVNLNSLNFYDEYISQVQLYQLDKQNNFTYGIELDQAYPINIGAIDYSYATQNEFVSVTVSLTYRRWRNIQAANYGDIR